MDIKTNKYNKMAKNRKVAIKSKGEDHGLKVIEYLESLGGNNIFIYGGYVAGQYYYINDKNNIDLDTFKPKGYTKIELPIKQPETIIDHEAELNKIKANLSKAIEKANTTIEAICVLKDSINEIIM